MLNKSWNLNRHISNNDFKKLRRTTDDYEYPQYDPVDNEGNLVPTDPHKFYELLGPIYHPRTKKPVLKLAPYQIKGWKLQLKHDLLVIKSNKVGYSTSALDMVIQNCLLKKSAGYEKLIICQTFQLAREHIYSIRKRLLDSPLANFLITEPKSYLLADEVTRIMEVYVENPYDWNHPSRIIGLGTSAGSVVSWKKVNYVLASDITMSKVDYNPILDGAGTRLANTEGRLHIETIPDEPIGRIYEMYMAIKAKEMKDMRLLEITASDAVKAKVITQDFLNKQKEKLGTLYYKYFGAKFMFGSNTIFLETEIDRCLQNIYDPSKPNHHCPTAIGVDAGFGSSKFAICVVMLEDNLLKVMYLKEFTRASYEAMINLIVQLNNIYRPQKIYVDGSKPDFIRSLKVQLNENAEYEQLIQIARREKTDYEYMMRVVPVSFNEFGTELLGKLQNVISKGWMAFNERDHLPLINQLRMAKSKENGNLDKDEVGDNTFDALDAARLALKMFYMPSR
jgi:terminase large subunit-like protein